MSSFTRIRRRSSVFSLERLLDIPPNFTPWRKAAGVWRDLSNITNAKTLLPLTGMFLLPVRRQEMFIFDRRVFHPLGEARPIALLRGADEIVAERPVRRGRTVNKIVRVPDGDRDIFVETTTGEILPLSEPRPAPAAVFYREPVGVWDCLKRKMRREVMHAFGHAGKRGQKKPKFTERSDVRC